jgi:type II secretory pathway pseudopilin PulG
VSTTNAHGFTLVELLVAQALSLAMMTVLVASLSSLYKRVQFSADAAENSETAYFLMDALAQWLSESRSLVFTLDSLSSLVWTEEGHKPTAIDDPCGTPPESPLAFSQAGVVVLPAGDASCLPSSSVNESSRVLLIERRVPCHADCREAGFYAALSDCSSGHAVPEWRSGDEARGSEARGDEARADGARGDDASAQKETGDMGSGDFEARDSDDKTCDVEPDLFQLHRIMIYVRDYARRQGDGIPALMMSRLAAEPERRWLRSDMLASGVFEWNLREQLGAHGAKAVMIGFSVKGKHQSTLVDRTITLNSRPFDPRPGDLRTVDHVAADLAWQ